MEIVLTGSSGTVGTALMEHLSDAYSITPIDTDPHPDHDTVIADVTDQESIQPHFQDHDALIHLALPPGTPGPGTNEIEWSEPFAENLQATNTVYDCAVSAGLESIIFASSNHAVGMVEQQQTPEVYFGGIRAGHDEPHRPDSLYGVLKAYGEDLGRFVAEEHSIRFYGLRIGSLRDPEYDHPYGDAEAGVERGEFDRESDAYRRQAARMKGLWISRADFAHLVECCLEDESVRWDHFYGVSNNARRWLDDLDYAAETIGYTPTDQGENWDGPPEE